MGSRSVSGAGLQAIRALAWRWHFYAGLYVAPFLGMLALTGLVMLFEAPLERWQFPDLVQGGSAASGVTHQQRLDAARAALPQARLVRYQPGRGDGEATRVAVELDARPYTVYVDDSSGRVLGHVEDARRLGDLAEKIHGTLLAGDLGDRLIEIAAGLGVLLVASGLVIWLPRGGSWLAALAVGRETRRGFWRDVHKLVGVTLAPVLVFYLISGLAWTGIWGGRLVQAWSTYPEQKRAPAAGAAHPGHESLNGGGAKVVPWNLEHSPLPESEPVAGREVSLDEAIAIARQHGIGERYWVGVPGSPSGVWTVAQTTMNGDVSDPARS